MFTTASVTILTVVAVVGVYTTEVEFEKGVFLKPVDPSSLSPDLLNNVKDPKDTGSLIYDSSQDNNYNKKLSLNFHVRDFKSQSSDLFRADPTFMRCLQEIRNHMSGKTVIINRGFKTASDLPGSTSMRDLYSRSGCSATLGFKSGETGDVKEIAEAALYHCPAIFASVQRDIGLIIMHKTLHIHMTGPGDTEPYFQLAGYESMANTEEFRTWALDKIDEYYDPINPSSCSSYTGLDEGGIYPEGSTSPEATVGKLDIQITREKAGDYGRLMQVPSRNVIFKNDDRDATWCGIQNQPCIDCRSAIKGHSLASRCGSRLVSPRLYYVIRQVQKMVRLYSVFGSAKLQVNAAFAEATSLHPSGPYPPGSLHYEGRAAEITLTGTPSSTLLKELSKLAICAGATYVQHKADHVYIAVKKQASTIAQHSRFPGIQLNHVVPPFEKKSHYELPEIGTELERKSRYIFDGDLQTSKLSDHTTIDMFKSHQSEARYFRLNPLLVQCFENIRYKENKWLKPTDLPVEIEVVTGYMTTVEERSKIPESDPRYNMHSSGLAMAIKYKDGSGPTKDVQRLAKISMDKCSPLFHREGKRIHLGVYGNNVYVGLGETLNVWLESDDVTMGNMTIEENVAWFRKRSMQAIQNRIVDPDNLENACMYANVPSRQSVDFKHDHPGYIKRRRRQAEPLSANECQPRSDTPFCRETKVHRDNEVEHMWQQINLKHLYRRSSDVQSALENCFGACGTCITGRIWEDKQEHCHNLLHWVPYDLKNVQHNYTNFFARDNIPLRKHACYGGQHCVDRSPLFSLVAPSVLHLYRPNPNQSVQNELYGSTDNPLPVFELLNKIYAMEAQGIVKFWTKDETELQSMRGSLQAAMLYNKRVTEVHVYVENPARRGHVTQALENMILEWSSKGCPTYTRETIAPYMVDDLPQAIVKRSLSPEHDLREKLLDQRRNWEYEWLRKTSN
ncbi:unnamed protein product [Owenia fusiformis]|uniref:Uncharacterized protein n=1 Tax=Owenia fusiformis TaxID=6347 RepID=A0A8J1Y6K3_OWEFU|nr:unnamed protein product [Owenia fusiformis]